jgi:hypothetical protein
VHVEALTDFVHVPAPAIVPLPLLSLPAVCPRGFFESDSAAQACTRCPANQYCPGGDKVENPTSRGSNNTCGDNLVTRNTGARVQSDCLAPAGYARTSPTTATACATSEYAPRFNRLSKCLRCQSGLAENPAAQLTVSDRATKKNVCSEWSCCLPLTCMHSESLLTCRAVAAHATQFNCAVCASLPSQNASASILLRCWQCC